MAIQERYDLVVLGDHPGALLSGTLAAKLGLSVLFLPVAFESPMQKKISFSGQILDPEPNFMIGLSGADGREGLLFDCLNALNLNSEDLRQIQELESLSQVLTPNFRIAFGSNTEKLQLELERELPFDFLENLSLIESLYHAQAPLISFWKNFPRRLTLPLDKSKPKTSEISKLQELRAKLFKSTDSKQANLLPWFSVQDLRGACSSIEKQFYEFTQGLWRSLLGQDNPKILFFDFLHALGIGRTGAGFRGGMTEFRVFLLEQSKKWGADVSRDMSVSSIIIKQGLFNGIRLAQPANCEVVFAKALVLGCGLDSLRNNLQDEKKGILHIRGLKRSPMPCAWRFTVALSVPVSAIPPGATTRMIWQEEGAPPLEIELGMPKDYGIQDSETVYLFLRSFLPFSKKSLDRSYQRVSAARMVRQATQIVPFLEDQWLQICPDFRKVECNTFEFYPFQTLQQIPENLRVYSSAGVGFQSGISGISVASGESYPELGTLGGTKAALEAVATLAHRLGLRGPFREDSL